MSRVNPGLAATTQCQPASPGTVTAGSGFYSAVVQEIWIGTATPVFAGYAFQPVGRAYSNLSADMPNQDYTAVIGYIISGSVLEGGSGLPGVFLNGLPGNPTTDGSGNFNESIPSGWSGAIVPSLAGYVFSPTLRQYTSVTSDQTGQDFTAAADGTVLAISGTASEGGLGLLGVVLNGMPGNVSTNVLGLYYGTVSSGWSGVVVPALSGYAFTPVSRDYLNITTSQADQDYTATPDGGVIAVSGTVTSGGSGAADVDMSGFPTTVTTDASGYYYSTVTSGWSGTITPTHACYNFSPTDRTYASITTSQTDQDYTATVLTYTISGTVTSQGSGLQNVVKHYRIWFSGF